jgi:hypothetical protein
MAFPLENEDSLMITRTLLRTIRVDAEAALLDVAAKHGVQLTFGNGSFARDGSNASLKLEIAGITDNGDVLTKEATDFKRYASSFGLTPEDLGTTFTHNGKQFKLLGCNPRNHKYPIIAQNVKNGKRYKLESDVVKPVAKTGLTDDAKQEFLSLASRLSPENLHCDGEVSRTEAKRRQAQIMREWRSLEKRVGRKITEDQVWKWV